MDNYKEQIVKIKKTTSVYFIQSLIWLMAAAICVVCFYAIKISPIFILVGALSIYVAFKLNGQFNIEYEYTITNGLIDIDKIINKEIRKEIISFEVKSIENVSKFNKDFKKNNAGKLFICTDNFDKGIVLTVNIQTIGKCFIAFSPNEDIKKMIKVYAPRNLKNEFDN